MEEQVLAFAVLAVLTLEAKKLEVYGLALADQSVFELEEVIGVFGDVGAEEVTYRYFSEVRINGHVNKPIRTALDDRDLVVHRSLFRCLIQDTHQFAILVHLLGIKVIGVI